MDNRPDQGLSASFWTLPASKLVGSAGQPSAASFICVAAALLRRDRVSARST